MNLVKRLQAARCVAKLRSARALSPDDLEVIQTRLLEMGNAAIPPVVECLGHGVARGPALNVLRGLLTEESLPLYLDALASPNPAVVSGVSKVLGESDTYDPQPLLEILSDGRIVRAVIESVLLTQAHRIRPVAVLRCIQTAGKEERGILLRLLEATADDSVVVDLVQHLTHEDWWIRLYMVRLLAKFPGASTVSGLVRSLNDKNREVRLAAVQSLGTLEARGALTHLVRVLRDNDLKVQSEAIDTVSRLGDASTVPALLEILKEESEYSRRAAVEVLNAVATTEAVQDLVRALRDEDWWVRVRAADALGALGGDIVVQAVISCLDDSDDFIRRYAVEILNTVTSEHAVEPLVRALQDDDWWVKERAIDALGTTGDPRAVEPLIQLMQADAEVAHLCAKSLGILKDPRAVEPLKGLLAEATGDTREQIQVALFTLGRGGKDSGRRPDRRAASGSGDRGLLGLETEGGHGNSEVSASRVMSHSDSSDDKPSPVDSATRQRPTVVAPGYDGPINFHQLPDGTVLLDRYRVIRKVGTGGFGTVYLVQDTAIQEDVILKILNPQMSADETALRRFVRELKLTRKITHRNVIRIHDFLDLGGIHAVSMEYFEGGDLNDLLKEQKTVSVERTLVILEQAARGLVAAHEEGVIHRDVKPANILVDEADTVKIVDFGLALAGAQVGSRLTQSGLLIGTPEYMAPEQIRGDSVDHRADIYALGIILYEMVSGRQPFTAETPVKILFQHLEGEAPPLQDLVDNVPVSVGYLVASCMARDPEDRPRTATALVDMIADARRGLAA